MSTSTKNTPSTATRPTSLSPSQDERLKPLADVADYCQEYARQKPEVVAFLCFGVGFVLGWKLKPW